MIRRTAFLALCFAGRVYQIVWQPLLTFITGTHSSRCGWSCLLFPGLRRVFP